MESESGEISVAQAVLAGHALVTGGVIAVVVATMVLGGALFPEMSMVLLAGIGSALGWPWWSSMVPRWWRWALAKGVDPYDLQAAGEAAQLLWPRDSLLAKTERGNRWEGIDTFAPNPLMDLRDQLLAGAAPADFAKSTDLQLWGVVSEFGSSTSTTTLVTLDDGTCSLYTSSGGAVVDAGTRPAVQEAVERVVDLGKQLAPSLTPTRELTLPQPGEASFFALLSEGVVGFRAPVDEILDSHPEVAELYGAVQAVISAIRGPSAEAEPSSDFVELKVEEWNIRPGGPDDASDAAVANVEGWHAAFGGLLPPAFLAGLDVQERTAALRSRFNAPGYAMSVAELDDGRVVGFSDWGVSRYDEWPDDLELYAIYVLPRFQGRGMGRALFRAAALAAAERGSALILTVLAVNPHVAFYRTLGGTDVGRGTISLGGQDREVAYFRWDADALQAFL